MELSEAVRIDGASELRIYASAILPLRTLISLPIHPAIHLQVDDTPPLSEAYWSYMQCRCGLT